MLAAQFNRPGHEIVDHRTYVFLGDGCLMEGISHEACSLAGTLKLGKLICFYDDNGISIDGHVKAWFTDDTPKRFAAYGWHVVPDVDGHDSAAVDRRCAPRRRSPRPSLICCKTIIAKGSPQQGRHARSARRAARRQGDRGDARGHRLALRAVRDAAGRRRGLGRARARRRAEAGVERQVRRLCQRAFPELASEFERRMAGELPDRLRRNVDGALAAAEAKGETSRRARLRRTRSRRSAPSLPEFFGGSADLTGSNLTHWSGSQGAGPATMRGNYLNYGVREFGMAAIMNGIALHGGLLPYGGTFLTFSDYCRNALRMAALMKIRVIHVFTHDSIGLGEDGPTHQPIEHAATLRLIPNMDVWRPCDPEETLAAWAAAIERQDGPSSLLLSRQTVAFTRDSGRELQRRAPRRLRAVGGERRPRAGRDHRHRLGSAAGARAGRSCSPRRACARASSRCRARASSTARKRPIASACCGKGLPRVAVEAGVTDFWRKYVGLRRARRWHRQLRRIGARERCVQVLRLHAGARRESGQGHALRTAGRALLFVARPPRRQASPDRLQHPALRFQPPRRRALHWSKLQLRGIAVSTARRAAGQWTSAGAGRRLRGSRARAQRRCARIAGDVVQAEAARRQHRKHDKQSTRRSPAAASCASRRARAGPRSNRTDTAPARE